MPGFPADPQGNLIPILAPVYGSSQDYAVTASNAAPAAIKDTSAAASVRIIALGCDVWFRAGTGSTAPTGVDGCVPSGGMVEVPMTAAQTHMWVRSRSGNGYVHVDLLA